MKVTLADIIRKAAKMSGFSVEQLKGDDRSKPLSLYRFAVYKVARDRGFSFPGIGRALNRDHSTIMHGAATCVDYVARDPDFAAFVARLHDWVNQPIRLPLNVTFQFTFVPVEVAKPSPMPKPYRGKARNWFDNSDPLFAQDKESGLDLLCGSAALGNVIKEAMAV